jgi:hypothetical protein
MSEKLERMRDKYESRKNSFQTRANIDRRGRKMAVLSIPKITRDEMKEPGWVSVALLAKKSGFTGTAIRKWAMSGKLAARNYEGRLVIKEVPLPPQ